MRLASVPVLSVLVLAGFAPANAAERIPACRLDDSSRALVAETLGRAIQAYKDLGKGLAIQAVMVNPTVMLADQTTLDAYIIKDASQGKISREGCVSEQPAKGDALDALSVRGGCVVVAIDRPELRCSSDAVKLFGKTGERSGVANPALLYVLGHELAHLYQRRLGEYAGRVDVIDLQSPSADKLKLLRDACDPFSVKREADADAMSLEVLAQLLPRRPIARRSFPSAARFIGISTNSLWRPMPGSGRG